MAEIIRWHFPLSHPAANGLADSRALEPFRGGGLRFGVWVLAGAVAGEGVDLDRKIERITLAVESLEAQGVVCRVGGFAWNSKDKSPVQLDRDRWEEITEAFKRISAVFPTYDLVIDLEPRWAEPRYIGHSHEDAFKQVAAMSPFLKFCGDRDRPPGTLWIMPGRFRLLMCTTIASCGFFGWAEEYTYKVSDSGDWSFYDEAAAAHVGACNGRWLPGFKLSGVNMAFVTQMLRRGIHDAWFYPDIDIENWLEGKT